VLRDSDLGRSVIDLLDPTVESDQEGLVMQAVSGIMGADVLDYIDRDALNCGLNHRVDTALFRQIRFYNREDPDSPKFYSNTGGKYGIRSDRLFAVESLLSERYALFLKVYTHSAKIAADTVLSKALTIRRGPRNNGLQESVMEWHGDEVLIHSLATYSRHAEVANLGTRLRTRRLPKAAFRARLLNNDQLDDKNYNDVLSIRQRDGSLTPDGRADLELRIAKESGIDAPRVFVYLPSSAPGYKRVQHWSSSSPKERPQLESPQHGVEIGRRHLGLWEAWVFVSDANELEYTRIANAAESVLQLRNMIKAK
jgi:HD superfamily phosphohydrolase